jgi:transcriptional regulator with XRE-family HTH domain
VRRFNGKALYEALDARRASQGLTWRSLSQLIGVSASTMQRLPQGGRLEVDGMLAMVGWLGVPVESFVIESKN